MHTYAVRLWAFVGATYDCPKIVFFSVIVELIFISEAQNKINLSVDYIYKSITKMFKQIQMKYIL